ncbi:hypothetical protein [Puia dinghuensis]|uniref:LTXXQ motif family protein n=1 Tax=Puia dinghuensis TaxID=1792502 RepID=A0A8J2UH92_9BACT|nr:hypothetical protein [Puia dinghuensis]GGB17445.1 hypothetical protein GCM10011511_46540 [Puia dinghuensis]
MKRSLGFIMFVLGLNLIVHAQAPDTTGQPQKKPSPAKQAAHQLQILQQQLNLSEDQVQQLQVILINRDVALDSIRNNPSSDARTDNRSRRDINRDADQKINALLTDQQKPLYQQWKQQQREKAQEKAMEKRLQATQPQPGS